MEVLEKKQSELIYASRFPLMILVVLIHAIPFNTHQYETMFPALDLYKIFSLGISRNLAFIAVPCFFVISGFLFFKKIAVFTRKIYFTQVGKRFHTLLVPYLLWNLIFIIAVLLKNQFLAQASANDDYNSWVHRNTILNLFWSGETPINYPLWYLRDLISMVMLTPLFFIYFKYLGGFGMLLLIALNFTGIDVPVNGLGITGFTYFGLGAYLALKGENLVLIFARYKWPALAGAVLFACIAYLYIDTPHFIMVNRWYILFGVVTFFNGINHLLKNELMKRNLMKCAAPVFFIYCVHGIYFIEIIRGFFTRTNLAQGEAGMFVIYFCLPLAVLGSCLLLYTLLSRLFPSIMSFLLGGRQ